MPLTKKSRTAKDHKIITPDREKIGQEYWEKMGKTHAEDFGDITAQDRLKKQEIENLKLNQEYKGVKIDMNFMENFIVKKIMAKLKNPKFLAKHGASLIGMLDDCVDTEKEWQQVAELLRDGIEALIGCDIPLFDDPEEVKYLRKAVRWVHFKLEKAEAKLREKANG